MSEYETTLDETIELERHRYPSHLTDDEIRRILQEAARHNKEMPNVGNHGPA